VRRPRVLLAGVTTCAVVLLGVLVRVGWDPLADADRSADNHAHRLVHRHATALAWARAVTHLGDPLVVTAVAVVGALGCWLVHRRSDAVYLVLTRAVAIVVGTLLKDGVARTRPELAHPVAHASGYSFPSGHALGSAAAYMSLALVVSWERPAVLRVLVPLAAVVALVVGMTRVLLGVHYPSDVVAGLALGWAIALLVPARVGTLGSTKGNSR